MMRDIFGNVVTEAEARRLLKSKTPRPNGFAAPPGSGPAGETCSTCRHIRRVGNYPKTFRKCALIQWTHGPGTDIRARAPACRRWEPPTEAPTG